MRLLAIVLVLGGALAQGLGFKEALALALEHNPAYRNALSNLTQAEAELKALEADPTTLVLPLTQARQALELARLQVRAQRLSLVQQLLSAYGTLWDAQAGEELLRAQLALAERQLAVAQARRRVGNATELEVAQAEAGLRSARLNLEANLRARPAQVKALAAALGLPLEEEPRLEPLPEPPGLQVGLEALKEGLLTPALLQAEQARDLARLQVELSDNDYTPRLTLEKARTNLENAERSLNNLRAQAEADLEAAYAQARAAWDQYLLARENLALKAQALETARKALEAGTISLLQFQQEEVSHLQAETSLRQVLLAYWRALAALSLAAGRDLTGLGVE